VSLWSTWRGGVAGWEEVVEQGVGWRRWRGAVVSGMSGDRRRVELEDGQRVALELRARGVRDGLTGEVRGDLDLAAVADLAVPLWAIPADQRSTVAALCEHP